MSKSTPPPSPAETTVAYSYMRFSHPDQAQGDSLRRQRDLHAAWLKRNPGVVLDTSLMMTDRGKSAFSGDDRDGLKTFVDLVDAGRIAPGSFLIIENLDRLSRDKILPALLLVFNLLQAGIRIVQLTPAEIVYDSKSETMAVMMMIMELLRGHGESKRKSELIGGVWAQKKRLAAENGTPVSTQGPGWVRLVEGKWETIPSAVETVRRIFQLATDGHGISQITKMLNREGVPSLGAKEMYQIEENGQLVEKWRAANGGRWGAGCWRQPYVSLLVGDRRVIGEYQPHRYSGKKKVKDGAPVKDYYPAVISEQEWHAARQSIEGRRGKVGRIGKTDLNVFNGLLHDGTDGGTLHVVDKGAGRKCLVSSKSRDGIDGSQYVTFPLPVFERAVLGYLEEVDPADVFPQEREPDKTFEPPLPPRPQPRPQRGIFVPSSSGRRG